MLNYQARLRLHTSDFLPPGSDTSARSVPGGPGASLHWLTHQACGRHLVLIAWIEGRDPGLAIAVVNDEWQLRATHFLPGRLPEDSEGTLARDSYPYAAQLRVLQQGPEGLRAVLAIEQAARRHYPGGPSNPYDGGMVLTTGMADWIALEIDFGTGGATSIRTGGAPMHRVSSYRGLCNVAVQEQRYWLAVRDSLPAHWTPGDLSGADVPRCLHVTEDQQGLPGIWRPVAGSDHAMPVRSGTSVYGTMAAQPYDARHAVALLHLNGRTCLCLLDPAQASIAHAVPLRIARGYWTVKAWRTLPGQAGGYLWLHTNNEKSSAKHRDYTLWRIAYGCAARVRGKRTEALPVQIDRLTEERVITAACILDYTDLTVALWNHGLGVKHVEPMRCVRYLPEGHDILETAQDVAALAGTLPYWPARTAEHFGRQVEAPAQPRLPDLGLDFAGKRVLVYPWYSAGPAFPEGHVLGQIEA